MHIETVVCPVDNELIKINVPDRKKVKDVYFADYIFTTWIKKSDVRIICPHCRMDIHIQYE